MIVIVVVLLLIGGGIEPGACIGLGVGRIEALGAQQRTDIECRIVDPRNLGGRIEPPQPRDQRRLGLFRMRLFQQIALGDEDMIGQRDLAHRLDVIVERPRAVYGIDRRDDGADAIQPGQRRVRQESLDQRRRIGEPGRFDDDVIETRNLVRLARVIKIVERGDEIAEHGAAQAAVFQHHDGVVAARGEHVIETDFAEFVDHDGGVRHRRIAHRAVEQRRLAAAEKAGEDGDGRMGQACYLLPRRHALACIIR